MTNVSQRLSTIPNERFHATDVDGNQFSVVVEEYAEDLWDECVRLEAEMERLRTALKEICDAGDTDWSAKKMYWAARKALNDPC